MSKRFTRSCARVCRSTTSVSAITDDGDGCACRKPKPGMLYAVAVERTSGSLRSFLVGDRWRDIEAGMAAGCTTVLVNAFPEKARTEPDVELRDLSAAAEWIISRPQPASTP